MRSNQAQMDSRKNVMLPQSSYKPRWIDDQWSIVDDGMIYLEITQGWGRIHLDNDEDGSVVDEGMIFWYPRVLPILKN